MLTLQFMPYDEISKLASDERINKVLEVVKENKILLLEGRLKKDEEAELIKRTMEQIDEDFKGIELGVIYPDQQKDADFFKKMKTNMINMLLRQKRVHYPRTSNCCKGDKTGPKQDTAFYKSQVIIIKVIYN